MVLYGTTRDKDSSDLPRYEFALYHSSVFELNEDLKECNKEKSALKNALKRHHQDLLLEI